MLAPTCMKFICRYIPIYMVGAPVKKLCNADMHKFIN